jgi:hypothetical protein
MPNQRLLCPLFLLLSGFFLSAPVANAQAVDTHGTVTQTSGSQVVIQMDASLSVSEDTEGRIIGADGTEVATVSVRSVSESLVIVEVTEGSGADVEAGQRVAFASVQGDGGQQATLTLESSPQGAEVRLVAGGMTGNARSLGTTPTTVRLPTGTHRLRFRASQHIPLERIVTLHADTTRTLRVEFRAREERRTARRGSLVVRPTPDEATVSVDGTEVGTGPIATSVEAGEHEVRVRAPAYEPRRRTVLVEAGQRRGVSFDLSPKPGTLRVASTPDRALVTVDGEDVGRTPVTTTCSTGTVTVTVDKPQYESSERRITLSAGEERTLDVSLRRSLNVQLAAQQEGPVRTAQLERDGDQMRIQYALPTAQESYEVTVELSLNDGTTYQEIPDEMVSGDVGDEVPGGSGRTIRWAALQQYSEGLTGESNQVRIVAEKEAARNFPGRPGVVLEATLTPTFTSGSGIGGEDGAAGVRVGYATKRVAILLTGLRLSSSIADVWGLGPRLDVRLAEQGEDWPIGMHTTIDYQFFRSTISQSTTFRSGRRLQQTAEGRTHRLAWAFRAYYVWSIWDYFEIIPELAWTNLVASRSSTGIESSGLYETEQQGENTTVSFGGPLRGGLGVFIGSRAFGVHLKAVGYLNGAGVGLQGGLRF